MNTREFIELLGDKDSWPCCPNCQSPEMVMAGPFIGCIRCLFTGSARPFIQKFPILAQTKMKALSGPNGIFASIFTGPTDLVITDTAIRETRRARIMQINSLSYVAPALADGCVAAATGRFTNPMAVIYPEAGALTRFDQIEITSPFQLKMARLRGASADISILMEKKDEVIEATASFFGSPTVFLSAPVREILGPDWIPEIRYHDIDPEKAFGIQPMAWEIIPFADGRIFPRYVAALTVPGQLNVTIAVCEDMEGAPIVSSYRRDPASPLDYQVKRYEFGDSDEAVTEMKEKFASLKEGIGAAATGIVERSWDLDVDIAEIIGDLVSREPAAWTAAVSERGGTSFA